MVYVLFFLFLAIFAATAVVTLLGITKRLSIEEKYLKPLFTALILEVVGAVIVLFVAADFFGHTAEEFIERLPSELQAETEVETANGIRDLVSQLSNMKKESRLKEMRITQLEEVVSEYEEVKGHVLLLCAQLNLDIAKSAGGFINLTFNEEEKGEVAIRIHEALTAVGAIGPDVGNEPPAVHQALIDYQKMKGFQKVTGYFGRQTLNSVISDYLENARRDI